MNRKFRPIPRLRGVTLIEAVLFISIALGLIVGGIVFYQQASLAARVQSSARILNALIAEARTLNRLSGQWGGIQLIDRALIAGGSVPATAVVAPDRIELPSESRVQVRAGLSSVFGGPTMYDFLWLQIDNLPPQDCTRLLHFDASGNGPLGDGVAFLILGGAGTYYSNRGAGLDGAPANPIIGFGPGVAAGACAAAAQATGRVPTLTLVMVWTP